MHEWCPAPPGQTEADHVDRRPHVAFVDRPCGRARVAAARLEAVGNHHHRVDRPFGRGREVLGAALEREGQRGPAGRGGGIHLLVQRLLVDAFDRHDQLGGLAAFRPAGFRVVPAVAVDAEADVDPFPLGDGRDHVPHDALGGLHPRFAAADVLLHRPGGIEDQLDVDGPRRRLVLLILGGGLARRGRHQRQGEREHREDHRQENRPRQPGGEPTV
jgi:hypothetical protein